MPAGRITHEEHHAVLLDDYPMPDPVLTAKKWLDKSVFVLCSVSNKSAEDAKHKALRSNSIVAAIVDYDDSGYMDTAGNIWQYIYFLEAMNKEHDHVEA